MTPTSSSNNNTSENEKENTQNRHISSTLTSSSSSSSPMKDIAIHSSRNSNISIESNLTNPSSFNDYDNELNVSSTSLLKGDLDLHSDQDEEEDEQGDEEDEYAFQEDTINDRKQDKNDDHSNSLPFDLHLPDFDELMNQYKYTTSKRPPRQKETTQTHDDAIAPTPMNIANISVGTSSVKSQYFHSTTSQLESEGMSIAEESEYESLFSDESFLSISNETDEKESSTANNNASNTTMDQQQQQQQPHQHLTQQSLFLQDEEEGYQTPTSCSLPSYTSSSNSLHQPSTHSSSNRSLSSAASLVLNGGSVGTSKRRRNGKRHQDPSPSSPSHNKDIHPQTTTNTASRPLPPDSPVRQTTHKRLEQSIDFLKDDPETMTFSRKLALFLSKRYKWYNPRLNNIYTNVHHREANNGTSHNGSSGSSRKKGGDVEESYAEHDNAEPSIEVAWAYYEHMTLPRRLIAEKPLKSSTKTAKPSPSSSSSLSPSLNKDNLSSSILKRVFQERKMTIAVPGESNYQSKLYNPFTTPMSQMGDFGLGVGLYFGTLRFFTCLLILAGIVNIPNILFYGGEEYSDYQKGVSLWLKGSAACNDHTWVPCNNCVEEDSGYVSPFGQMEKSYRNHTLVNDLGQTMTFVLKNECDGAIFRVGMVNFGTVLLFIVGMVVLAWYLRKKQVQFDLDEQTAQDYSITIHNPPSDAYDPEEWKYYFKEAFPDCAGLHVTSVTVALDNGELLDCLMKRRELVEKLKLTLPDMEDVQDVKLLTKNVNFILKDSNVIQRLYANNLGVGAMYKKLMKLNEKIQVLTKDVCPVTSVFIMFETEKAQRHVLEKLTVSKYEVKKNNVHALPDPKYLFRNKIVLDVAEAEEPSTVRWNEMNITRKDFFVKFLTTLVVFALIVVVAYIVKWCNDQRGDNVAAMAIAIFNVAFPQVAKLIASFERHSREETMQVSLYFKIAFFRWVNTAIVIWLITPFTSTTLPTEGGVLQFVWKIFLSEIATTNGLKWLDVSENLKKHFVAPRASTQEKMNLYFRGSEVFLAERYTNLTKIVFLSVWYCSIYPAVLFMGAVALGVNYYFDRFALMRTWRPQPKLGVSISHYTKNFVFPLTIILMTYFANYMWGSFRFDYLCDTNKNIESEYYNTSWEIPSSTEIHVETDRNLTLSEGTLYYEFCPRKNWNTRDQSRIVSIFENLGHTNIGVVSLFFLVAVGRIARSYFYTKHESVGDDQNIAMRNVDSMTAYIPQVISDSFAYPLIACNVEEIKDSDLFEWEDPLRPYEYYDMTKDLKRVLTETEYARVDESKTFSKMVYWPYR